MRCNFLLVATLPEEAREQKNLRAKAGSPADPQFSE